MGCRVKRTPIKRTRWGVSSKPAKPLVRHRVLRARNPERCAKKLREYRNRLARKDWGIMKALCWLRDQGRCVNCGIQLDSIRDSQLGHNTYVRFGEERLSDVGTNCPPCNLAERTSRAWYRGRIAA